MRGDNYLWADDINVHIWVRDGYDNWDESGWNEPSATNREEARPSGVAIRFDVADEFVVMRVAELIDEGRLKETITRAIQKWNGNGGCLALTRLSERLKQLESDAKT